MINQLQDLHAIQRTRKMLKRKEKKIIVKYERKMRRKLKIDPKVILTKQNVMDWMQGNFRPPQSIVIRSPLSSPVLISSTEPSPTFQPESPNLPPILFVPLPPPLMTLPPPIGRISSIINQNPPNSLELEPELVVNHRPISREPYRETIKTWLRHDYEFDNILGASWEEFRRMHQNPRNRSI